MTSAAPPPVGAKAVSSQHISVPSASSGPAPFCAQYLPPAISGPARRVPHPT